MDARRQNNGFGWQRIGWADLYAWAQLNGLRPTPFELACLDGIEDAFFGAKTEGEQTKAKRRKAKR